MKQTISGRKRQLNNEEHERVKWFLAPVIAAAFFFITGTIGGLFFENPVQAQKTNQLQALPPDSSLLFMDYRNNWANYISLSTATGIHPGVEGIKDLSVSIHNQTNKVLDEVQIKIDFISSNGKTYKSETIVVPGIESSSTKTVTGPDSDKGISVKMGIISIQAKSFHFCYTKEMKTTNSADPYFCK